MRTPLFWKQKNTLSTLLLPLGWVYALVTKLRIKRTRPYKAARPVICVGNLTAGGSGKTPVSLSLAGLLKDMGFHPAFITRGYGGKIKNIMVDPSRHTAELAGDEPMLLAAAAPTFINPDRARAAQTAISQAEADVLIMDDGFQNPGLFKDLSFLVFDGAYGIGNGRVIPAGPLRETCAEGLKRAQALIILGPDKSGIAALNPELPVFYAQTEPLAPKVKNRKALAFAGIGHPQKFYQSLAQAGVTIDKTVDFPDHHFYTREEILKLISEAAASDLVLYTTSKDYVKIPADLQSHFEVLEIKINWQDPARLRKFLQDRLAAL